MSMVYVRIEDIITYKFSWRQSYFLLVCERLFFFWNTKNIQFWTIKHRALANYSDTIIFRKYYEKYLVNKGKTRVLEKLRLISRNSLLAEYAWPREVPTFLTCNFFSRLQNSGFLFHHEMKEKLRIALWQRASPTWSGLAAAPTARREHTRQ